MSAKKPAPITGAIIATKGTAAPSSQVKPAQVQAAANPVQDAKKSPADDKRIAVTVRLTEDEYRKLKLYGLNTRKSNQDIFVEALSAFLSKEGRSE